MSILDISQLKSKFYALLALFDKEEEAPEVTPASNDTSISDSLCSKNLTNTDMYERNNTDKNTKLPRSERRANKRNIRDIFKLRYVNC